MSPYNTWNIVDTQQIFIHLCYLIICVTAYHLASIIYELQGSYESSAKTRVHKEDWAPKNWYFQTVVLEKTLENPLDSKEIKSVSPKGKQPWIFIGRTDAEAEAPILWPLDAKSQLIGKDPDAGKVWGLGGEGGDREWDS